MLIAVQRKDGGREQRFRSNDKSGQMSLSINIVKESCSEENAIHDNLLVISSEELSCNFLIVTYNRDSDHYRYHTFSQENMLTKTQYSLNS